ncbi:MAG TPA: glycosyl hydrolase family 8 [Solirubrobacteraceae bacterium]|jgi:cellulose synthase/poly-beta-1,6-N-acetylglucosamine synthase-like glycosyltransferase/endo-1,4-beta-D-glucanase Y|nr:glycosyl hydrolase family 8 [Solirubrobacteraceae bacterium]
MGLSLRSSREPTRAGARETRDPRLLAPTWSAPAPPGLRGRLAAMVAITVALAVFYFTWLLSPAHIGDPALYGILLGAELFNLVQAAGFWWTALGARPGGSAPRGWRGSPPAVDVFIPVYGEPVTVVEPTVAAARRMHGARVRVYLLDDAQDPAMRWLADRHAVHYVTRPQHTGAKAGHLNHALARTRAPFVLVLDCDHVPDPRLLTATLGHLQEPHVAFVQTPQYYANAREGGIAAAAWAQQALFFGVIARGKDGHGAMFCAGTNVLFARAALEDAGGFPESSLTEDFALSIRLHERGWRSRYVPHVLARGLGPADAASYVSQQQRWARGCLGGLALSLRARLPLRVRVQYLLSSLYFLSGWTVLAYMSFPVIRILAGAQPLAGATADQFLLHFAPYFCASLGTVAVAGAGAYTWPAFSLAAASFWIHIRASLLTLLRRRGRFVVTPKRGADAPQPRAAWPALLALAVLLGVTAYGLTLQGTPATLNNVTFALLHITVLASGVWAAVFGAARLPAARPATSRAGRRAARQRALVPAALALAGGLAIAAGVVGAEGARPPASTVRVPPSTAAVVRGAGAAFLDRYELSDGRVSRLDQGGDSVSEGQAYAMLVSAALGDRARFQAAWQWAEQHLREPDGLLASHWVSGRVVDPQPASDADLDTARALALAARRWASPSYAAQSRVLAQAILRQETAGAVLLAGPWARGQRIVDPSYLSPQTYTILAHVDERDAVRWHALAAEGTRELAALTRGGALPPNWATASPAGRLSAIGSPSQAGVAPEYGFDAVRVPVRLADSCSAADRATAASLWPTLRRAGTPTPATMTLSGQPLTTRSDPVALVAAAAAASAARDRGQAFALLARAQALDARSPSYYGAAWVALGRIMLQTDWLDASSCAPAGGPQLPVLRAPSPGLARVLRRAASSPLGRPAGRR